MKKIQILLTCLQLGIPKSNVEVSLYCFSNDGTNGANFLWGSLFIVKSQNRNFHEKKLKRFTPENIVLITLVKKV